MVRRAEKPVLGPVVWLWSVFLLLCLVIVVESSHQYPVMDSDATWFWPPAISYARSHALINPLTTQFDPAGQGRLVYHGFLSEMVEGSVSVPATYTALRTVMTVILLLTLALFLVYLTQEATRRKPGLSAWDAWLLVACLGAFTTYSDDLGRPELFTTLLLLAGLLLLKKLPERWEALCLGVTTGLAAAANPLPGILIFLIACVFLCLKHPAGRAMTRLVSAGLLAAVVFFSCFLIYPYPFRDWVAGMLLNSRYQMIRPDTGGGFYYLFLFPNRTFLGGILILALCAAVVQWKRCWRKIEFKGGAILFTVLLSLVIWKTSLATPVRAYGLIALSPIAFALIVRWFDDLRLPRASAGAGLTVQGQGSVRLSQRGLAAKWASAAIIFLISLGSIGYLREVAALPTFLRSGLPYSVARRDLMRFRAQHPGKIGITGGMFTLTEDYANIGAYRDTLDNATGLQAGDFDYLMVQQTYRGQLLPPFIPGYRLMFSNFSFVQARLFRLKLGNTPQGYNYAFYEKIPVPVPK